MRSHLHAGYPGLGSTNQRRCEMYVVVLHRITNAEAAFSRGERLMKNDGAPAGVRVLQFYPSRDRSTVTCLLEAPSVDVVQAYVDSTLGDSSENTCYDVDSEFAFARQPLGVRESMGEPGRRLRVADFRLSSEVVVPMKVCTG
jgi:hypothetical protein